MYILEGFITVEDMKNSIEELESMQLTSTIDGDSVKELMIQTLNRQLENHPDGYWLAYWKKNNYNEFCRCSQYTIHDLPKRAWRVVDVKGDEMPHILDDILQLASTII